MKYFNPSYWFKLWVLSAPLFIDRQQGINANSINNKNIKYWSSNSTNLQSNENQYLNLLNNQTIQFKNNENIKSIKTFETDDFYENFLKTQHKRKKRTNRPQIVKNLDWFYHRSVPTATELLYDFGFTYIITLILSNRLSHPINDMILPPNLLWGEADISVNNIGDIFDRRLWSENPWMERNEEFSLARSPSLVIDTLNSLFEYITNNPDHSYSFTLSTNLGWASSVFLNNYVNFNNNNFLSSIENLFIHEGDERHTMINTVSRTYNTLFASHLYNFIRRSLDYRSPFIFLAHISNFPPRVLPNNRRTARRSRNYFLVVGMNRAANTPAEDTIYTVYDHFRRSGNNWQTQNFYYMTGVEILATMQRSNVPLQFITTYTQDRIRQLDNNDVIRTSIDDSLVYRNFMHDRHMFSLWEIQIQSWLYSDETIQLNCENFNKYKDNYQKPPKPRSQIETNHECSIHIDSLSMKLKDENLYAELILNINNRDNSRQKFDKFLSTDKGFYFVKFNNTEISKIGDFKKIIEIISDKHGSVYILDEFEKKYHINLYDIDHTTIFSNILINSFDFNHIISKLEYYQKDSNKLSIITSLHQIQTNEYNYETYWGQNDIFVGTTQGAYLYNPGLQILDKFSNLDILVKKFELTRSEAYSISQQGWKFHLNWFDYKKIYNPYYQVNSLRDFKYEKDVWGSNNLLWLHISYDNIIHMMHSFIYNNKNNFVNFLLNDYLNKLNISYLFDESEKNNIVNSIWKNFPHIHEQILNIQDNQNLVLHIDGAGNWLYNNLWLEKSYAKQIIITDNEKNNFQPVYEIETEIDNQQLQVIGQVWHSNEVMFRISHYNIHQMFKSFIYESKNDFINNFINNFLKKLLIKKVGSFLNRDYFYEDYYTGLANTIWTHFGDFHEKALSVKPNEAIYFDMFALKDSLDGSLSIVQDRISVHNQHCHYELRSSDAQSCDLGNSLIINSKYQLLKSIHILAEPKNSTKWNSDIKNQIDEIDLKNQSSTYNNNLTIKSTQI